jgi:hypothetical protein
MTSDGPINIGDCSEALALGRMRRASAKASSTTRPAEAAQEDLSQLLPSVPTLATTAPQSFVDQCLIAPMIIALNAALPLLSIFILDHDTQIEPMKHRLRNGYFKPRVTGTDLA